MKKIKMSVRIFMILCVCVCVKRDEKRDCFIINDWEKRHHLKTVEVERRKLSEI
jgi:hypothetical protein